MYIKHSRFFLDVTKRSYKEILSDSDWSNDLGMSGDEYHPNETEMLDDSDDEMSTTKRNHSRKKPTNIANMSKKPFQSTAEQSCKYFVE